MRIAVGLLAIVSAIAGNWPQWRGPSLNGTSDEKNLPITWSQETNVVWKLAMPSWSGSTPIVWGDRIFLNVAEGRNLALWSVDASSGSVLWKRHLSGGNVKMRKQNMSSPSPVTDGTKVWAMTGTGVLKAFDYEGKELWSRDIQKDYGQFGLYWGYASSPLLHEDALYIQVLHGMKTDDPSYILESTKPQEEPSGVSNARRKQSVNRRTPTPRPLSSGMARLLNSSSAGVMSPLDTTSRQERNSGEPADSTRPIARRIG